jgi:pimeloyl-ACP methyl ester carboxylesterase
MMYAIARWWFTRAAMFFLKPAPWPMEFPDHSVKVLFIGGEKDPVARPEDIREQMKWYPEADVWFVPNAGHANASLVAADEYVKRVLAVFAEAFKR